jgi:hypothetical protein
MYEQIYTWLAEQFAGNDVFAGLVGASAIGTAMLLARSVPARLWRLAVRFGSVTLEIDNTDDATGRLTPAATASTRPGIWCPAKDGTCSCIAAVLLC